MSRYSKAPGGYTLVDTETYIRLLEQECSKASLPHPHQYQHRQSQLTQPPQRYQQYPHQQWPPTLSSHQDQHTQPEQWPPQSQQTRGLWQEPQSTDICIAYINGGCEGGCGKQHPKECWYHAKGKQCPHTRCRFAHFCGAPAVASSAEICRDYQKGCCTRGNTCWYQHIRYGDECVNIHPAQDDRYGQCSAPTATKTQECKHYIRTGCCMFGKDCKYVHPRQCDDAEQCSQPADTKRPADTKQPCRHFLRGHCERGGACGFRHSTQDVSTKPCFDYIKGNCTRADCRYAHTDVQAPPETQPAQTPLFGDDDVRCDDWSAQPTGK
jgi:hypothetical protein